MSRKQEKLSIEHEMVDMYLLTVCFTKNSAVQITSSFIFQINSGKYRNLSKYLNTFTLFY